MSNSVNDGKQESSEEGFEYLSAQRPPGVIEEILGLIRYNKKWFLIPLLVALLLVGVILFLGSTAAAPFIYTLF